MKKHVVLLTLLTVILAGKGFGQGNKSYTLNFNPANGEKYNMEMVTDTKVTQSYMGQDMKINMKYIVDALYDINASGSNKALSMTYDKIIMDMDMMGQNIEMNSESPDSTNPQNQSFRALKGATVTAIIKSDGTVIDVQGAEALIDRLGNADGPAKEGLKRLVGKDAIKSIMEGSFKIYPDKKVKVGDSWTSITAIESPYKMSSNNTYTLNKVENGRAYVNVTSATSTNGPQKMNANGMEMSVDLTGDATGSIEMDLGSGMPLKTNVIQNLKGKMEMMGSEIPMTIITDLKTVSVKK